MFLLFLFLAVFSYNDCSEINSSINYQDTSCVSTIYISQNDDLKLFTLKDNYWFYYIPEYRGYDNLPQKAKIIYNKKLIFENKKKEINFKKMKCGTYYIGINSQIDSLQIILAYPIHLLYDNIVQVVVRENDSYLGYLTEQLEVPFLLPPKLIGIYGHQADLRVGIDCAELAIYGMRRLGCNIPYCGPRGIVNYCFETQKISKGTIIHFGFQVSILYEDRGKIGLLDSNDLLIHAFEDKVKIESFGETKLKNEKYKLYKWNF